MIADQCGKSAWSCDVYKYAKSGFAMLQMLIDAQFMQVNIATYAYIFCFHIIQLRL